MYYVCLSLTVNVVIVITLVFSLMWTTRDSSTPQIKWGAESGSYQWTKQVSDLRLA